MGGGRQALVDRRVEPVKMGTLGCTHDSVDAIWCRRLECLLAATCLQTFNEHVKSAGCLGGSVVLEAKRSTHRRRSLRESRSRRESQHGIVLQYALSAARHHLPGPARRVARPAHQSLAAQLQHSNRGNRPRLPKKANSTAKPSRVRRCLDIARAWSSGVRVQDSSGPRHGWSWRTGAGRWSRIDPGQRLDQRSTLDAEVAAHGCLRHAIVQRSKNGIQLLADYHRRSPTHPAATPSRCQPCHHPLSCEGALVRLCCKPDEGVWWLMPSDPGDVRPRTSATSRLT